MNVITSKARVIAVIPCLNEEKFIGAIVEKTLNHVDSVMVINDGSDDDTAIAAAKAGAEVVNHRSRQGAGAATRTGFVAAGKQGADIVVTIDGDGQHDPDQIPQVIQPVMQRQADLVIGSRFLKPETNMPAYRKFGIDVITWLYNFGSRQKILDAQSGFRAYSRAALGQINITENGFGFSIQTLVQARRSGLVITEVPISCFYHAAAHTSHPLLHGINVACTVLKLRFREELYYRKSALAGKT